MDVDEARRQLASVAYKIGSRLELSDEQLAVIVGAAQWGPGHMVVYNNSLENSPLVQGVSFSWPSHQTLLEEVAFFSNVWLTLNAASDYQTVKKRSTEANCIVAASLYLRGHPPEKIRSLVRSDVWEALVDALEHTPLRKKVLCWNS